MLQMPLFDTPHWTVSELTMYLRDIFQSDPALQDIWVQGEVSNFTRHSSGHIYFSLKDGKSSLRCVMWRNLANRLIVLPKDGQAIEAHGSINIYELSGQYQLYVDVIRPLGEGLLFQEFIQLKNRLQEEGLFEQDRKLPIPAWPKQIGIVTSPTGAALQDILNTINRRFPLAEVFIAPAGVQGADAADSMVRALLDLNNIRPALDLIIIARGGGSMEDLWAFNDEGLARAISASNIPVISGVGHETDFTIADFVADLRAPTPTAAAELATPNIIDIQNSLAAREHNLLNAETTRLINQRQVLQNLSTQFTQLSPLSKIQNERQRLDEMSMRNIRLAKSFIQLDKSELEGLAGKINVLNPFSVLKRGYAIVSNLEGNIIRSVSAVSKQSVVRIQLQDGKISAEVLDSPG
jgi:exodeoxyribonuclease VII large subunit